MLSGTGGWCAATSHPPGSARLIDRIVGNGLRAPSAGFSQGWGFLVLDNPADLARFRDAVRPTPTPRGGLRRRWTRRC